jgi:hypothetical protein
MNWLLILEKIRNRLEENSIIVQNIFLEDSCRIRIHTDTLTNYSNLIDLAKPFKIGIDSEEGYESIIIFD